MPLAPRTVRLLAGLAALLVVAAAAAGTVPSGGNQVISGWDGRYQELSQREPWLRPLAMVETGGGYTDPGMAITWSAATAGPVTFYGMLDPAASSGTQPARDLMVVLAFHSPGLDRLHWVTRLPVTAVAP